MIALGRSPLLNLLPTAAISTARTRSAKEDITHLPPEQLAESIWRKEQQIAEIITEIKELLTKQGV